MERLCGKVDRDGGEKGEAKTDEEKEERDCLKVKMGKTETLWELTVELFEEAKVVVLLYHHSKEDD